MGVTAPGVEEDVIKPSQHRVAMRHSAAVVLEEEVGGLYHVGNPSLVKDGAEGLMHKAMTKLETSRTPVTATQQCMISIRVHEGSATQIYGVKGK